MPTEATFRTGVLIGDRKYFELFQKLTNIFNVPDSKRSEVTQLLPLFLKPRKSTKGWQSEICCKTLEELLKLFKSNLVPSREYTIAWIEFILYVIRELSPDSCDKEIYDRCKVNSLHILNWFVKDYKKHSSKNVTKPSYLFVTEFLVKASNSIVRMDQYDRSWSRSEDLHTLAMKFMARSLHYKCFWNNMQETQGLKIVTTVVYSTMCDEYKVFTVFYESYITQNNQDRPRMKATLKLLAALCEDSVNFPRFLWYWATETLNALKDEYKHWLEDWAEDDEQDTDNIMAIIYPPTRRIGAVAFILSAVAPYLFKSGMEAELEIFLLDYPDKFILNEIDGTRLIMPYLILITNFSKAKYSDYYTARDLALFALSLLYQNHGVSSNSTYEQASLSLAKLLDSPNLPQLKICLGSQLEKLACRLTTLSLESPIHIEIDNLHKTIVKTIITS